MLAFDIETCQLTTKHMDQRFTRNPRAVKNDCIYPVYLGADKKVKNTDFEKYLNAYKLC